ncbi:MAG TPA: hypothetical protein VMU89_24575 [Thermomicrobiaceae bacterium]|nr:hypothetical protein [Thermomicrobiaceae bacterium]
MDEGRADSERALRVYLVGAVIVWIGMIAATAIMLGGTAHFSPMLLILSGGALWFVLLVPTVLRRR